MANCGPSGARQTFSGTGSSALDQATALLLVSANNGTRFCGPLCGRLDGDLSVGHERGEHRAGEGRRVGLEFSARLP